MALRTIQPKTEMTGSWVKVSDQSLTLVATRSSGVGDVEYIVATSTPLESHSGSIMTDGIWDGRLTAGSELYFRAERGVSITIHRDGN